jgi:hypothetical protein
MDIRRLRLLSGAFLIVTVLFALGWRTLSAQAAGLPPYAAQTAIDLQKDGLSDDSGGDDGGDDGSDDEIKVYGVVASMPSSGLTGSWLISGATYLADDQTEFEMEHGGFAAGICVEVEADKSTPTVATKIGTESAYKCTGADDNDDGSPEFEGKFYGKIASLPAGPAFLGPWIVGSETVTVTAATRLEQEDASFAAGVVVEVEFREVNGQKIASSIESKFDGGSGDDDHGDDDGRHDGHDGQAYGPIVTLPSGMTGTWVIAGLSYSVTTSTNLDNEGTFAPGVNVKVEYYTTSAGERIATEIEITNNNGGVDDTNTFKFVGWVTAKPSAFVGVWTIGGQSFTAVATTRFEEEHSLLTVSSYVEATYKLEGDQRILVKLEAEVPPGAGDDDSIGAVENMGDDNPTAASADATANVWRIGGKDFIVIPSTQIVDATVALTLGSTALVNSYTNVNGANVATRIQPVSMDFRIMLPLLLR